MADLRLITAPSTTPVSLVEACSHLRETDNDNNDEVIVKLKAAVDYCQRRISGGRQFCSATYDYYLPEFPQLDDAIVLPMPPLSNVTWIKYYDTNGALQTWGSTTGSTGSTGYYYTIKAQDTPGYVKPAYNKTWPSTRDRPDAVTVRFVAGSTDTDDVPDVVKAAALLKLEHLYDPERVEESQQNRAIDSLLGCAGWGHYG